MAVVTEDGLLCSLIKSQALRKMRSTWEEAVTYPFVLSAQILSSIAKQAILSFGAGGQCPVASVAGVGAGHAPLNEAQITADHSGNKVRILIFSEVDSKTILKVKLMVVRYVTGSWEVPGLSPAY